MASERRCLAVPSSSFADMYWPTWLGMAPQHTAAASSLSQSLIYRGLYSQRIPREQQERRRVQTNVERTDASTAMRRYESTTADKLPSPARPYYTRLYVAGALRPMYFAGRTPCILVRGAIKSVSYYNGLAGQSLYDQVHTAIVSSGKLLFCQKHEPF